MENPQTGTNGILFDPNYKFTEAPKAAKSYAMKSLLSFLFAGFVNGFVVDLVSGFFNVQGGSDQMGFILSIIFRSIAGILGLTISTGVQGVL